MKRSFLFFAVCIAVLAFSPLAEAQRPGGGGRGRGGFGGFGFGGGRGGIDKITLVGLEQVQKELKLEGEKKTAVDELVGKYREDSRSLFTGLGNFQDMSQDERAAAMEEMGKKRAELAKKYEADVAKSLSEEQMTRLTQIEVQQMGTRALSEEAIAKKLDISAEQQEKIAKIQADMATAQGEIFQSARDAGPDGFGQMREKQQALQEKTDGELMAVLTDDQKKSFEEMKGKPFELDRAAMFGGGRGPGGPGAGGPGGGRPGGGAGGGNRRPPTE